jgi:hypothetical protein
VQVKLALAKESYERIEAELAQHIVAMRIHGDSSASGSSRTNDGTEGVGRNTRAEQRTTSYEGATDAATTRTAVDVPPWVYSASPGFFEGATALVRLTAGESAMLLGNFAGTLLGNWRGTCIKLLKHYSSLQSCLGSCRESYVAGKLLDMLPD